MQGSAAMQCANVCKWSKLRAATLCRVTLHAPRKVVLYNVAPTHCHGSVAATVVRPHVQASCSVSVKPQARARMQLEPFRYSTDSIGSSMAVSLRTCWNRLRRKRGKCGERCFRAQLGWGLHNGIRVGRQVE